MTTATSTASGLLRDKVAVVTGAARGIGRATAIAFAREGADIIGLDICAPVDPRSGVEPSTPEDLEETGRLVRTAGRRGLGIKLDQRDLPALRAAALRGEQEFGGIDILFANAGIQSFHPLLDMEDPDWHITIDVNLTGTANAIRAIAPYIVKRGSGRIILTSSTQGQHGTKYGASYSASKWGIVGLMKSAALELAPYNVTVNALVPGLIDGGISSGRGRGPKDSHRQDAARRALDRAQRCRACGGVPGLRRRAHGFGCDLRCHRGRQRSQYSVIAYRRALGQSMSDAENQECMQSRGVCQADIRAGWFSLSGWKSG